MKPNFHQLVEGALCAVATEEPIFQSEASLQRALASQLKTMTPLLDVQTEVRLFDNRNTSADIVLGFRGWKHVVELKYPKQKLLWTAPDGEIFDLRFGANDLYRHGILMKIARVEEFIAALPQTTGSVVALTNTAALWKTPKPTGCDAEFNLGDGALVTGDLDWAPHTAEKIVASYGRVPAFRGRYLARWSPYSDFHVKNGEFRYLAVSIVDGSEETS
ncbi:hypothetical protein PVT71_00295 [Salipiger sp. H15]|uniref:NERD domain-containing protein n=1 Tax=Alloyangia sp. H15 TaxID=3029062 RepID=A0AAU8AGY4_9RHOB